MTIKPGGKVGQNQDLLFALSDCAHRNPAVMEKRTSNWVR